MLPLSVALELPASLMALPQAATLPCQQLKAMPVAVVLLRRLLSSAARGARADAAMPPS